MDEKLVRYSVQLAFLRQLLEYRQISDDELEIIKVKLMKDYNIISDLSAKCD